MVKSRNFSYLKKPMSILTKYSKALSDVKSYLQKDLKSLNIFSAQIYGSAAYEHGFIEGVSDIDICAFSKKFKEYSPEKIIKIINESSGDFKDKHPTILRDHIANRIEFYVNHPAIPFDITILAPEFPNKKNLIETASYDSLEMLVGTLYKHGLSLFGEIPDKNFIEKNFYPFYDENLRRERLKKLTPRVLNYTNRVQILTKREDPDLLDHLYKTRTHFLKWLFIFFKKYPVHLNKHIAYQLTNILKLPQEEKNALLFMGRGSLFELSSNYLKVSQKYLNKYFQSK